MRNYQVLTVLGYGDSRPVPTSTTEMRVYGSRETRLDMSTTILRRPFPPLDHQYIQACHSGIKS